MSDVPTKLDDEFGDRHNQLFSRHLDQVRSSQSTDGGRGRPHRQNSCELQRKVSTRAMSDPLYRPTTRPGRSGVKRSKKGIAMTLKKIVGIGAIAGALGFSAIGLGGVANAAPTPQVTPGLIQHAQLTGWGGPGWHGPGGPGWHDPGWRGPGWGGPGAGGLGWRGPGWGGPGWRGPGWGGPGWGGPGWGGPGWR
jgi:hypothetical protein